MKKQEIEIGDFVTLWPIDNLTLFGTVVGFKDTKTLENKNWKKDLELTTNK